MKKLFAVTVTGRVDKYGVDMTRRILVESSCAWTTDTLQPAIAELAQRDDGISGTRIVDFQPMSPSDPYEGFDRRLDLDPLLGI